VVLSHAAPHTQNQNNSTKSQPKIKTETQDFPNACHKHASSPHNKTCSKKKIAGLGQRRHSIKGERLATTRGEDLTTSAVAATTEGSPILCGLAIWAWRSEAVDEDEDTLFDFKGRRQNP
ncbi:hypothetical protein V8G54_008481, partial [Vigna mungo]